MVGWLYQGDDIQRQRETKTERQTGRHTDKQTDRQTETEIETDTDTDTDTHRVRSELKMYNTRIKILGGCLFLQSVPANLHANRLHIKQQ